MLTFGCEPYDRSILKIPKFCKVGERDCDCHLNIINNTTVALTDGNLESGNLFHTDTLRVVA